MNILKALSKFFGRYTSFFIAEKEKDSPDQEKTAKRVPKGEKRVIQQTKDEENSKDKPESKIIEKSDAPLDLPDHNHRLKDLRKELDLLNKSFAEEIGIDFKAKNKTAVNRISASLTPEIHIQNLIPEYEEVNNRKRSKRREEILKIQNSKKEILSFSLVEIHIEREEKRKEKERLEKERKLDEEFSKLINSSQKELLNHEFKKAAEKLKEARIVRPEKAEEIDKQIKDISDKEKKYKKEKLEQKFRELIKKSEIALENLEFDKGRLYLREAQTISPGMKSQIELLIENLNKAEIDYQKRKLEREYNDLKRESNEALGSKEFKTAVAVLEKCFTLIPEKKEEINSLIDKVKKEESNHKKRKEEFEKLFRKAEDNFHANKLEKAISLFEKAEKLEINSFKCRRRISDAKNKIQRLKKLEKERQEKARIEKLLKEKYKEDADAIISFYKSNGIAQFYHYTDSRNLNSILQNNGLFSLNELQRRNINFLQGSETGEKPDYVRLSYTSEHPLKHVSIRQGRIRIAETLIIDLEVAKLKNTQFSNVNAARTSSHPTVTFGSDLNYLQHSLKFSVFGNMPYWSLNDEDKAYYQAEIMVKDHLELEYIINLKA